MFLTQKTYDLENFLQALNFISPKGMSVAYFITPKEGVQLPDNSGFKVEVLDTPEDESITYSRQQPVQKQDQAITPADYSVFDPGELGRRPPTPNILPPVTSPEMLDSPFIQTLSECETFGTDLKLLEDYLMFPKNTIFHCVTTNKLNEGIFDDIRARNTPEGLAADPGYKARRDAYLARKKKATKEKTVENKNIFTFNQVAKMLPDGMEPEFIETKIPFEYDIKIGDKLFKKISGPSSKIEKYKLIENSQFEEIYRLQEMKWEKPAGLITKALGFGEDVSGFKYGERYNGMFPDGG
ncbi:MAG: hypothetical protein LBF97_05490, partial [Elusimicrobiota bacterium]|nr:hypothetical protein [Elusimicrobiota bacterium]